MKINTSDLTGAALDWAVAKCEDLKWLGAQRCLQVLFPNAPRWVPWRPSADWAQGGPIIDRKLIVSGPDPARGWMARSYCDATEFYGSTRLIAAMRCYVAGELGDEVEIPETLL